MTRAAEEEAATALAILLGSATRGVLYHSGTADEAAEIARHGILPRVGDWLKHVAAGATSEDFDVERLSVSVAFYSESPTWIVRKVAQKLRRNFSSLTLEDVRCHGHLAMVYADDAEFFRVPEEGYDGREMERLDGERVWVSGTPLSRYDAELGMNLEPFGLEPGDIVCAETVRPFATLCGDALISFMTEVAPEEIASLPSGRTPRRVRR